ncbi:MAG: 50S ribosomal protein L27, partial [Bacteroidota bacterium]
DDTLFALKAGRVKFHMISKSRQAVSIIPN